MLPVVGPSPLSVNPIFEIGPLEPRFSEYLVFEGISVDEQVSHLGESILSSYSSTDTFSCCVGAGPAALP